MVLLLAPASLGAQQATVSPFVERFLDRDTTLTVWLFVRPERPLAEVTAMVTQAGGQVRSESRWLHAVSANLPTSALRSLRQRPELLRIQPVARFVGRPEPGIGAAPAFAAPPPAPAADDYGPSIMPYRRLNLLPLANRGFHGAGVKIAILDTGFETGLPVFAGTTVLAQRDFINNDSVVRDQAGDCQVFDHIHGTWTWSLLGGNQQGGILGIARDAQFILAKTEDACQEVRMEEDNYVKALEWADSLGANIVSSSLGYFRFDNGTGYTKADLNGDIAVTTMAVDIAAQRGITVVTAAGNDGAQGPQTLGTPADADSAIAVGAVDSLGVLQGFSSRGPTADGRIKPDLTAPGHVVWVATRAGTGGTGFTRLDGTSFSTPIMAGAAALLKQLLPAYGPIDIRDALRNAGDNNRAPDSNKGWGTPDVTAAAWLRLETLNAPGNTDVRSTQPTLIWSSPMTTANFGPFLYDVRVVRAATNTVDLDMRQLSTTSLVPPRPLAFNVAYRWLVTAHLGGDSATIASPGTFTIVDDNLPALTLLFQNFPNPFPDRATGRRRTCIWFDLATAGTVKLDILDLRGHIVRNLVPGTAFETDLPAGHYGRSGADCDPALEWDGTAQNGAFVPQGIYLVKLAAPDGTTFKRIVYLGAGIF